MGLFYAFIDTLRQYPDSSPDSLGLQGPKRLGRPRHLSSTSQVPVRELAAAAGLHHRF